MGKRRVGAGVVGVRGLGGGGCRAEGGEARISESEEKLSKRGEAKGRGVMSEENGVKHAAQFEPEDENKFVLEQ